MSTRTAPTGRSDEIERSVQYLAELNVESVRLEWCDLHGVSRGKQMSVPHFQEALRSGTTFSSAALQMDLRGDAHPLPSQSNPPAWNNVLAIPDPSTLQRYYGAPDSARCLADIFDSHGAPSSLSARQVLKSVVAAGSSMGAEARIGFELEFYLLPGQATQLADGMQPASILPRGRHVYRMQHSEEEYRFLEPLRRQMSECGIKAEAFCGEDGPGQFEVILGRGPALAMADAAFTARALIKEQAARQGLVATFLSRPLQDQSGSGCHIHQSLWSLDGSCLFLAGSEADEAPFWRYLQGQLDHFEESVAFFLPTINAYKRIAARQPEPLRIGWAFEDRSAALRVLGKSGGQLRVENRAVAGEANPYLALAASLACGLEGLRADHSGASRSGPPPSGPRPVPRTLDDALDHLERSEVLRRWLGGDIIDAFMAVKRAETRRYHAAVTDWELREYLHDL